MRTIQDMIQQEVLCCLSSLIATLSNGSGCIDAHSRNAPRDDAAKALADLSEQALELSMPIPDYEQAGIDAGWKWREDGDFEAVTEPDTGLVVCHDSWQALCEANDIEPHDREVFEHWAVTDWFANKLETAGEKVDKDFADLCIWARTTTGQAIHADGVIERIYAETHKADAA